MVRRIDAGGTVSTLAGTAGKEGFADGHSILRVFHLFFSMFKNNNIHLRKGFDD